MCMNPIQTINIPYTGYRQSKKQSHSLDSSFNFLTKFYSQQSPIISQQHEKSTDITVTHVPWLVSIHNLSEQEKTDFFGTEQSTIKNNADVQPSWELSEEQTELLKSKYDVENIDGKQQLRLLCELKNMGIISEKEVSDFGRIQLDPRINGRLFKKEEDPFLKLIGFNPYNMIELYQHSFEMEMAQYDYMENQYGKGFGSNEVKERAESYQRLLDILKQLTASETISG